MTVRSIFILLLFILVSACSSLTPEHTQTSVPPTSSLPRLPSPTALWPATDPEITTPTIQAQVSPTSDSQVPDSPAATLAASTAGVSSVSSLPNASNYTWEPVVNGLQKPVGLVNAGDGSERMFAIEQEGLIRIIKESELFSESFLDIRRRVGSKTNEQGLLGLAFHPRYTENGYFYVNYTDRDGDTVISRFTVSEDDPNRADANSEKHLMAIAQPYRNHNGGAVAFGPDGFLYLGLGDGGSGNDPHRNAQSTNTHLGKILRIDIDEGENYAIPQDNPFVNGGGLPEIWAYGLRNPWRFAFDRLTGDFYIGDVGQKSWEEIDFFPFGSPSGANFGWVYREGAHLHKDTPPDGLNMIDPIMEYDHTQGCSVTGGVVYRGAELPDWQGVYLYGDYCSGNVWGLLQNPDGSWQGALMFETGTNIPTFGEDEMGEVYLVDHNGGVYRLSE